MTLPLDGLTRKPFWREREIVALLEKMDDGYHPTREERRVLHERSELILNDATITSIPESIGNLTGLRVLGLAFTNISRLPESIGQLSMLEELDLKYTRLTSLPDTTGKLSNLKTLNLSDSKITFLPEAIGTLKNLQTLNLNGSQIRILPKAIGQLTSLQELDISITRIEKIPDELCRLHHLQYLYLHGTRISALPDSIGELISLRKLSLSSTPISNLPESIGKLINLQELYLTGTNILSLPDSVSCLVALQTLGIGHTSISSLPISLALSKHEIFNTVGGNTPGIYAGATKLPPYYYEEKEILARYLRSDDSVCAFREAKIIFLGDGSAGKTYTINRFMEEGAIETVEGQYSKGQTHGVKPYDYRYKKHGIDFSIHLWDFGGQELFHAMHRCFLTDNTVYVLMVSTRPAEHTRRLRYWLHNIHPYAKDTKVLVIINQFDGEGKADIDEIGLKNEFKDDMDIHFESLSVKNTLPDVFRKRIMEPLIQQAEEAEAATGQHPMAYMQIKDQVKAALETSKDEAGRERGWIPSSDYVSICVKEGITSAREQAGLLRYFTNLGVCFSDIGPREEKVVEDLRLIQPVWLTNALYAVIEECKPHHGWIGIEAIQNCLAGEPGRGRSQRYIRMKPELRYDSDDCSYMLKVAQRFFLAYRDPEDNEEIFFPATCSYADKLPDNSWKPEKAEYAVTCEVEYPYFSETVIQRLMLDCLVEGFRHLDCWRGGFHFIHDNCSGIINVVNDDRVLKLELYGDSKESPVIKKLDWFRKHLGLPDSSSDGPKEFIVNGVERYPLQRLLNAYKRRITRIPKEFDENSEFRLSELIGTYPVSDTFARGFDVSWARFAANYKNTRVDFEQLCTDLFRLEYFDFDTVFKFIPNNPGLETHPQRAKHGDCSGKLLGFQAKYFDGSVGYPQIKKSIDEAIKYYHKDHATGSGIETIILYCNKSISQSDENGGPKGNVTFAETENLLLDAGIELKVLAANDLLSRIRKYPQLVEQYFFV